MRHLITTVAVRLGWTPVCGCHTAVLASAQAHAEAEAEVCHLRRRLAELETTTPTTAAHAARS